MEKWKDIPGYEGQYMVSNQGRVRSMDRVVCKKDNTKQYFAGKILIPYPGKTSPYLQLSLCKHGVRRHFMIHRLVAQAFLPEWNTIKEVNHKDGNKLNNCSDNLEMCTRRENYRHAIINNLKKDYAENHVHAKLTNTQAADIRELHRQGVLQVELAKRFGVCKQTICNIIHYKSYHYAGPEF